MRLRARGDLATVMAYHHPDVIKALSFHNYQSGRDAVEAGLRSGFQQYRMEFVEHRLEYLMIRGDTAIEQSLFTIRSTRKPEALLSSSMAARWWSTCVTRRVRQDGLLFAR
ncbi:MAG: hypothetical protein WCB58_10120 [Acidobacteriaceae bacterium]